jgi:hypothetical protein
MNSVVVRDIESLARYMETLKVKKYELESIYLSLNVETLNQESNWSDPQYEILKEQISSYCMNSKSQLEELDNVINYINSLLSKIRDL